MNRMLLLAKLYLSPRRCLEDIVRECLLVERPDREEHIRQREWERIVEIRKAGFSSLRFVAAIGLCGCACGVLMGKLFLVSELDILILRIFASLIIAWAVFSKLGKEIESWEGKSLPEQLNSLSFRVTYFIGTSLLIGTLFLEPEIEDEISLHPVHGGQHEDITVDEELGKNKKITGKQSGGVP